MRNVKRNAVLTIVLCLAAATALAGARVMSVQAKYASVRSSPSFTAGVIAELAYGTRVTVLREQAGWFLVQIPDRNAEGWVHGGSLTEKKVGMKAGDASVGKTASSNELALAGKGFDKQVESAFRSRHPNMDFGWINRMEAFRVSGSEIKRFMAEGELGGRGGGS